MDLRPAALAALRPGHAESTLDDLHRLGLRGGVTIVPLAVDTPLACVRFHDQHYSFQGERALREWIIEMKLPVSVRFEGLAVGEIEHLDFEIDGTPAGIRSTYSRPSR